MALINWAFVTSTQYYAEGVTYDDNTLYFLQDTQEIMRGSKPFSESVVLVDDTAAGSFDAALAAITAPARRRLYISSTTLEAKIYNGTAWVQVIKPVTDEVTEDGTNPVTGKAVAEYVAAQIEELNGSGAVVTGVSYNAETKKLTVTSGEESNDLELDGLGVEIAYDKETGALVLKDVTGAVLGQTVNLDLERFVSAAAYDETNKQIILAFTGVTGIAGGTYTDTDMPADPTEGLACKVGDDWKVYTGGAWTNLTDAPLTINVGDLVDTYTAEDSETISLTVSGNKFKGAVKVSAEDGNALEAKEDGLYVAAADLSDCMKLIEDAVENNIATFDDKGHVKDSGLAVGGATLAEAPNATTIATEAAVAAVRAALTAQIEAKATKVDGAVAGNLAGLTATGDLADSGKKVGGATLAATPDENTVATEAAVAAAVKEVGDAAIQKDSIATELGADATDDEVPSAKAVVDALTWKTTM